LKDDSTLLWALPFVHVYIDNLIIASKDWNEHKLHVQQVIARTNELNSDMRYLQQVSSQTLRRSIRFLPDLEAPLNRARATQEAFDREVAFYGFLT
jgi:hypothetical protein